MRMYLNTRRSLITTSLVAALLLAGCAAGSNVRLSDGGQAGSPGAMWEDGQKSVETGEAMVSRGEKKLELGRRQVRDGEAQVSDGNRRVLQARLDYEAEAEASRGAATPAEADAAAKRLRTIGKRWESAIAYIKDGNKLVDQGNRNIDKGQAEIREGRMLMESGSILMRNSQRSRLGDRLLPAAPKQ